MTKADLPADTNSLCVHFSAEKASVAQAYRELAEFGELACVEVPPGQQTIAVVSYFDVRAAVHAREALGGRCVASPQRGERTVVLPGNAELSDWMIGEVSKVHRSGDMFLLEFYDTRTAEKVAAQFQARSITDLRLSAPPGLGPEVDSRSARTADDQSDGTPRKRNDLRLSQISWQDLASGWEWRTTLQLRCLPPPLCSEEALQQMLLRAGLANCVDCIRVFKGEKQRMGSALVNAVDAEGVMKVAKYLHGRHWGRSMPIAVSFSAQQGAAEVRQACPKYEREGAWKKGLAVPWRVEACYGGLRTPDDLGASEVSTEIGDEPELTVRRQR